MDTALTQLHDRLSALERENALLRSQLQSCEQESLQFSVSNASEHRLLEATAQVANALLTISPLDQAVNTALQIIGESLETDRVTVIENFAPSFNPASIGWKVLYEWTSPHTMSQVSHPALSQGTWEGIEEWYKHLSQGQSLSCLLEEMPEPYRSGQAELGLKAFYVVPIFVEDKYWGEIGFDDCRELKCRTPTEFSVLKIAADCVGSAIQQKRNQQAILKAEQARSAELQQALGCLSESEERFRILFELSSEGFYYTEVNPPCPIDLPLEEQCDWLYQNIQVVQANPAFAAMYGADHPDQLIGLRNADVHVEGSVKNSRFIRDTIANNYRFRNLETEECDQQRRQRYFLNSGAYIIKDGYAIGSWSTQIDITELRETQQALLQAEQARVAELIATNEELQRHERILEATAQVANALLTISPFDQAVNTALQIIGESLETDRVAVIENFALSFNSASMRWKVLYEWTSPYATSQISHPDLSQGTWEGIEEWYELLSQDQSISYLLEEMPEPFRSGQAELGLKALYAVPIFVEGKYWGVIGFDDCREAERRSPAELSVLKIAADCIGSAIQRDRTQQVILEAEQARSAELEKVNGALKRTVDVLAMETDLDRFLGQVLRVIAEQLEAPLVEYWYHPEPANLAYVGLTYWQGQILKPEEQPGHVGSFGYPVPPEMIQQESLHHRQSHFITEDMATSPLLIQIAHESGLDTGAWYGSRGVSSALNVPLLLGDKTIGALIVFFPRSRHFTEQQIELTYAFAQQVTLAVQLTRLAEAAKQTAIAREQKQAAQHQAAELARANTLLRDSLSDLSTNPNLNDVLGHLLVEVVRYAGATVGHIFSYDADQNTLNLTIRCQDEQHFLTPADDEPILFQSPIPVEHTLIFSQLCEQPRLAVLNQEDFEGRLWQGASEWFQTRGYQGTSACVLMVGDRPLGLLAMAFPQPVAFSSVEEELVLALAQQIALVLQLTILGESDKQAALAKLNEVLAREQEIAAQERAAELAKANEALGRSLNRLANERNLDSFLEHVLQEALQMLDGAIAQIFTYDSESDTLMASVAVDLQGEALPVPGLMNNLPISEAFPATVTQAWERMLNQRSPIYFDLDRDASDYWPGTLDWHRNMGHCGSVCTALMMGDRPLGMLGLALRGRTEFTASELEFFQALGQQATLAMQMSQLAEEARQSAILNERNRMAGEIHDTLAQAFTGISLQIEVVKSLVYEESQTVQQILKHISQLAEAGLTEARRSVWALHPLADEYADLAQLLYESVEQMTRNTSVAVEVNVQGSPCSLPPFIGMNLLRIGQEAVTNALKHAQADTLAIELAYDSDRISLTIYDNGRGFTPPTTLDNINGGFGLISMYERCDRIGAQLSLSSQPGQGTQILVEAPLS